MCRSTLTHTFREVELLKYTLLLIRDCSTSNKIQCAVDIQTPESFATVDLIVDTGASVSVLPQSVYIICFGHTHQEHDAALDAVLKTPQRGWPTNEKKCNLRQSCLRFLRHMVNGDGIQPDEEHLLAITQAPAPNDVTGLRSVLGMLSWYKFIPNYATLVESLRACVRQDSEFKWTDEAQRSFTKVKKCLTNSPALALFDPELPVIVSTDASDYGLGVILAQVHPDHSEHTVVFASRTLTAAIRRYSTVEKEALACVWAVEKWRTYLWERRFTLRTDHQALTTLDGPGCALLAGPPVSCASLTTWCTVLAPVYFCFRLR